MVLDCCRHDDDTKYQLHAVVVMPDHVHMILTPQIDKARHEVFSLIQIMRAVKGASAHLINRRAVRSGPVWQEESFDRVLRSSEKLDEKIAYVLENPARRGLVTDWRDYRWLWYREPSNPYAPPRIT